MGTRFTKLNVKTYLRFQTAKAVQDVANEFRKNIQSDIRLELRRILYADPTIISLNEGDLTSQFGLTESNSKVRSLVDAIVETIVLQGSKVSRRIGKKGTSVRITGIPLDFYSLTKHRFALQKTERGQYLPWLRWLLFEGRGTIVNKHIIVYKKIGRSGKPGIMIKGRSGWRVPYRFAGTQNNNFITRAIKRNTTQINKAVRDSLTLAVRNANKKRKRRR